MDDRIGADWHKASARHRVATDAIGRLSQSKSWLSLSPTTRCQARAVTQVGILADGYRPRTKTLHDRSCVTLIASARSIRL